MAAWVGLARTSFSLYSRCFPDHCFASLGARWKKVHQQPPQTPLCFSTIRSKSGHVSLLSSLIRNRVLGCLTCFVREDKLPSGSTFRLVNFFISRISRTFLINPYQIQSVLMASIFWKGGASE